MSRTFLQSQVFKITRAIDDAEGTGVLSTTERQDLYKSVFLLLAGDPVVRPNLIEFCKKARKFKVLHDLYKSIGRVVKLPQVLHATVAKKASRKSAEAMWGVASSDTDLVQQIAAVAQIDAEAQQHLLRRHYSSIELAWLAEVELEFEEVQVIVNNQALDDMLLGVLETYMVPKSKKEPFSEVYGLCLGMASRLKTTKKGAGTRTKWFVYVDKSVPQIRAVGTADSVSPNIRSLEALVDSASSLFPQLEIIGDYHSHPYREVAEMKSARGWEASENDAEDIVNIYHGLKTHPKRQHRMRVTFVVAIARGRGRGRAPVRLRGKNSILRLNVAGCHVYVSAYRILSNGFITNEGVTLILNTGEHYRRVG